ncbi:UNVERIFIED_CONTAM: putative disease resistance RPP13-like protein 1 [Sesamum calycinum]|uniref:Disease resistance RPP13-like protein 1 n=1 Tax=Sesamum calycinum TaxID=2727403 RepID=A0AAW2SUI9_9LAMI
MAEGLLVENDGNDMESLGSRVYDILLQNSFFQEAEKNEFGIIKHSKMHDLLHDLACSISKVESFNVENHKSDIIPPRVRNLAIRSLDDHESYKMALKRMQIICELCFQVIRYLIAFWTLRALRCFSLQELPSQLRSLISLRHLVVHRGEDFEMPLEIGKLTCLRTLKFFNIGHENGRRIEELGYLKNLRGKVVIRRLQHVNGKAEAARACLTEKPNIHKLKLVWSRSREGNNFDDEQVLEGLDPHPNIKSLSIEGFCGDNLPSWIMNRSISDQVIRLEKLIELELINCKRCLEIPTLGCLPLLKFLVLTGLENVKSIGPSFYYPHNYDINESRRRRNNRLAFPALEKFTLGSMTNLEEWIEMSSNDSDQVVNAFPRLEYLKIDDCPNISRFPSHSFLCVKELEINGVKKRGGLLLDGISNNNFSSLTSLRLNNVSDVTCLPKRLLYDKQRIMSMYIGNCPSLTHIELSAHNLKSLETICIYDCEKLKSIRYLIQGEAESGGFNSLQTLHLSNCRNLVSFPIDFRSLPSCLLILSISQCLRLRSLPNGCISCLSGLTELWIGPFSIEVGLASFNEIFQGIQQLHSLETLELFGWPLFESLPDNLQHITTLKYFKIYDFGMEALPEWIGTLASLEYLSLYRCRRMKHLPSKQCLTKLTYLSIEDCGELSERCRPHESEWHKISHISSIHVEGKWLWSEDQ